MSRFVLTAQLQLQAPNNVAQVVRQIQSQLNNVNVNIQVQNSQQAQRQLQQITQSTNQATSAANRMGKAFAASIRRFAAFSIATRAVGLFTSTLSDATQTAIDFERQLIKVAQVTGKSVGELRDLTNEITRLSTGLGVSSQSLLEVSTILAQAGLSANDTKVALNALAKAALAPNFDSITETAEGAIAILAQFGQGVEALESQLGSINAVAGAFAVEASDLIDVIRRTGGVFKSSGGSLNELLALFTSVRATTRESAESIGTGLRTIFTRIQRPKTIEFLKQFGVELLDLEGKFVGPYEAVRRLSEGLAGLGERDITFIKIAEELGGFRQIGKVLPLLQQFATAEAALNVATKANNSLTSDAISAQAALAIRITKVKEEFLALVRGITETSTFQIMANTALALASALIKLADSIKPLLPLLGAMAAVKVVKGLGGFLGGIGAGLTSGRTFNKGGKVHHFARGGMVPGTGNRDTVPAMLSPGEFVIRKSSVNKLGAGNLAAMNENRYATGGIATQNRAGMAVGDLLNNQDPSTATAIDGSAPVTARSVLTAIPGIPPFGNSSLLQRYSGNKPITELDDIMSKALGFTSKTYRTRAEGITSDEYMAFNNALGPAIEGAVIQSAGQLANSMGVTNASRPVFTQDFRSSLPKGLIGSLFEIILDTFNDKPISGSESRRPFDFTTGIKPIGTMYRNLAGINYVDAKISPGNRNTNISQEEFTRKINNQLAVDVFDDYVRMVSNQSDLMGPIDSNKSAKLRTIDAMKKTKKANGGLIQKFATGGGVGTDTVPALLTPGEFVVNRSSAQRIGYGNLNRMNKVGKYAKGGVVQKFATGTAGTGAKPSTGSSSGSGSLAAWQAATSGNTKAVEQNTSSQQQNRRSVGESIAANKMFAASMTVGLLQSFLPALDENSSALTRMSHGLVGLVSTITTVGFALEAFGIALNVRQIMQLFGTGPGGLGSIISSAFKGFKMGSSGMAGPMPLGGGMASKAGEMFGKVRSSASDIGSTVKASFDLGRQGKSLTSLTGDKVPIQYRAGNALGRGFEKVASSKFGSAAGSVAKRVGGVASAIGSRVAPYASAPITGFKAGMAGKNIVGGNATTMALGKFGQSLSTIAKGFKTFSGSLLLVELGLMAASSAVNSFFDYQNQTNKAIQEGNIEKASENAANVAAQESIDSFGSSAILAGAAIGSLVPGVGTLLGGIIGAGVALTTKFLPSLEKAIFGTDYVNQAFIGLGTLFGGNTYDSIKDLASAQAQATKTQKAFEQGQKDASSALEDLQNGTISASTALSRIANVEESRQALQKANEKAIESNKGNKSGMVGGFLRGTARVATLGLAGYLGLESGKQRNQRIDKENVGMIKQNAEAEMKSFDIARPVVNESMKRGIAQGMTREQIDAQLGANSAGSKRSRMTELRIKASEADIAGNEEEAKAYRDQATILEQQANELDKSFENLQKEAERTKKAFEAMNLGMQNVQGSAAAASLSINNYVSAQQAGNIPLQQSLATLEASVTSAAQGISDADFSSALGDAEATLRKFGANDQQINKFKGNLKAVNEIQKNSSTIFKQTKADLQGKLSSGSTEDRKKSFSEILGKNLKNQGYDTDTIKRLQDQIGTLSEDQINALGQGDFTVFEQVMGDLGKKVLDQVNGPLNDAIKIQEQLNQLTQNRIEAEKQLLSAQQEALNVRMEARDIQAKYGGKAVTPEERRQNIIQRANIQSSGISGVGALRTGSAAEIMQKNRELANRQAQLGAVRNASAAGDKKSQGQLQNEAGLALQEEERKLAEASKSQLEITRELIKAKEQELQITQEKNKLEKQSLESLITGDIEKFFEQQAAVGATAAIATGNQDLMNQFGASALGAAYTDIQRQQEAGVQSIYGQQIAGPGGLGEQAAGAALAARGVQNPAAVQMLAGTTPEEEGIKAEIRALAETMGPTADLQTQAANLQLQAAQMQYQAASQKGSEAVAQMQARQMASGGAVYASNGIFVPRGTDTVPAMLTPGEFVVNRGAVNRGNNLQILRAINNGSSPAALSRGGKVSYYNNGGVVQYKALGDLIARAGQAIGIDPKIITNLGNVFTSFTDSFNASIKNLQDTKFQIKLDTTNINVNLNGGSFLENLAGKIKEDLIQYVGKEISQYKVGSGGSLVKNSSTLPTG